MGLLWGGGQGDDAGPAAWTRCGGGEEPGFRGEKAGQLRGSRPGPGARSRAPSSTPGRFQRLLPAERRIASRRKAGSCVPVPDSAPQKGDRQETSIPRGETCSPARVGVHTSIYTHTTHIDTRIDIHTHYTHGYAHTIHRDIYVHIDTDRSTQAHTCHTHRCTHTQHTQIHTDMYTVYTEKYTYTQIQTGTHRHSRHTHTDVHTHRHTNTHTHIHSPQTQIHTTHRAVYIHRNRYTHRYTSTHI